MRQTWSDGAAAWVAHEAVFDRVFAPVTEAVLRAAAFAPGDRVLDVGCGTGTLLAAAVAAGADAVGVDISPGMGEAARQRVPAVRVQVADAQSAELAAYDVVVSRFGVMFFADPAAAFANLHAAAAPGARLALGVWRGREENPMFTLGHEALTSRLDPPYAVAGPGEPGPTSLADPDRTRSLLTGAGWQDVGLTPVDFECVYTDVEERLATVLATTSGRRARAELEPALGPGRWAALLEEIRAELRGHVRDGSLRFPGAVWLVTARA